MQVHPDNIDIAVRAARLFGLRNAGIDIISADIGRPWHENGAIINEVNYAPYFGGNPVAKAKLPDFFDGFTVGDGRIPIIAYVGGEAAWQQGALLYVGLPVDRIDEIHPCTGDIAAGDAGPKVSGAAWTTAMLDLLRLYQNQNQEACSALQPTDERAACIDPPRRPFTTDVPVRLP